MRGVKFKKEIYQKIYDLLKEGYNTSEIADELGMVPQTVQAIRRRMINKGLIKEPVWKRSRQSEISMRKWLNAHWHWKIENPPKKTTGKYRVVKKGEKGHLRTPYRPDGIFK